MSIITSQNMSMNERKEYYAKWREENREHVNAFNRDYTKRNASQRKETTRRYRQRSKFNPIGHIRQMVRTARVAAKKRGFEFEISVELINAFILMQNECCALTGIRFDYSAHDRTRSRPFAPSIDRKDNSIGYRFDNIQIVCCIVNRAKNEYPQELFDAMCRARVKVLNG